MAFWNTTSLDPKRQFKFKVYFGDPAMGVVPFYLAQSVDRPTYTISDGAKVHFLDKEFKFPGKVTWNNVKIKFIDGAGPGENMARSAYSYLIKSGWYNPDKVAGYQAAPGSNVNLGTVNKQAANRGQQVLVEGLDSVGNVIDSFTLRNSFIKTATLSSYDYTAEAILTADIEIVYDWAELRELNLA
jgi:hypothetical protein